MSLDFSVTQWFRLIYSDLSLICDVYYLVYMHRARRRTLTLREFGEVLMNLMEVEACNFDDNVSTDKLRVTLLLSVVIGFIGYSSNVNTNIQCHPVPTLRESKALKRIYFDTSFVNTLQYFL